VFVTKGSFTVLCVCCGDGHQLWLVMVMFVWLSVRRYCSQFIICAWLCDVCHRNFKDFSKFDAHMAAHIWATVVCQSYIPCVCNKPALHFHITQRDLKRVWGFCVCWLLHSCSLPSLTTTS
jgi:hypothetical protein